MDKAQQIVQSAQPTNSGMISRYTHTALQPRRSPPKDYSSLGIWAAIFGLAVTVAVFGSTMLGPW